MQAPAAIEVDALERRVGRQWGEVLQGRLREIALLAWECGCQDAAQPSATHGHLKPSTRRQGSDIGQGAAALHAEMAQSWARREGLEAGEPGARFRLDETQRRTVLEAL